jgi:UDP-N-acetylmuramate dehydrogenase
MLHLLPDVSLLPYNTFGIDVPAEFFAAIHSLADIEELSAQKSSIKILGGGSNILLTGPVRGVVAHNMLQGIDTVREDETHVWVEAQAGVVWHDLVLYAIAKGLGGVENLALIPGTVGAAPIQNIGAYGVEVCEVIEQVSFWHLQDKALVHCSNQSCAFGYRDSVFKNGMKGAAFVTSVLIRLNKQPHFNTSYGAIEAELTRIGVQQLSVQAIAQAVMNIRRSKLPDPRVTGNAGSFFKNPTISAALYDELAAQHPGIPCFRLSDTHVKVPAAWLIEHCGWKGYRRGDAGVHSLQALVIVNYGTATGSELWQLSNEVVQSVLSKYGLLLEREVQVW